MCLLSCSKICKPGWGCASEWTLQTPGVSSLEGNSLSGQGSHAGNHKDTTGHTQGRSHSLGKKLTQSAYFRQDLKSPP